MRTARLLIFALPLLMMFMASCGDDRAAYRRGADDAVRSIQNHAMQSKQQLRDRLQPSLFIGALFVLAVTFFGDVIAERLRDELVARLDLTPERQESLAGIGYALVCGVIAVWSLARCGVNWALPVVMLLAGATAVFFTGYQPALHQPANEPRRLALSKIKLLLFACAVILAVHELLASDGWLRLPG